mmetsp:Transcript_35370/g.119738  ORF Transcript_35370/g.119738 Transcript_35370/m.119738 type:complete len:203 (+) Transcript_35370:238-846(+)
MASSARRSTLAVASSQTRRFAPLSKARAKQSSCASPPDTSSPPARIARSGPSASRSPARASASRSAPSFAFPKGSRFDRTVPENSVAACGTTATPRRNTASGSAATSTPSIRTRPPARGASRSSAVTSVDLPAPVRPTTPQRLPGATAKDTRRSVSVGLDAYRKHTSSKASAPAGNGAAPGGAAPPGSSFGSFVAYSSQRST